MSPLEIKILLHYFWSPIDYHEAEEARRVATPAVCCALEMFAKNDLLRSRYGDLSWAIDMSRCTNENYLGSKVERPIFSITDKGRAMVKHLCAVQIPVCKWVQPEATP
jgi:hypothetical protein